MKTQLICTFVKQSEIESTLKLIGGNYDVVNDKVFLMKSLPAPHEYILSYNVALLEYKQFLRNSISVHRKKETNTIYTINALNELILGLNNGVLDKSYSIDWERYRDILLIKRPAGLVRLKLEKVTVYTV